MRIVRVVLGVVLLIVLLVLALWLTPGVELGEVGDRLAGLFFTFQSYLPATLSFERFLLVTTAVSVLVTIGVVIGVAVLLMVVSLRLSIAHQRQLGQAAAAKREVGHLRDEQIRRFDQLIGLGQSLTGWLDKPVLVQAIVEAASRIVSAPQANSPVGLWLLHFDTDTLHLEASLYCDGALFTQTAYSPNEQPFAQVIQTQKPRPIPSWDPTAGFLRTERVGQLGTATSLIVVPLLVERSVLGVLTVFCHSDLVKSYEQHRSFYEAVWAELSLALAIAIQGELAILDRLSGVHNREYFMKRLVQELDRSNRYQLPLALLMIDIDNFKLVNDMLGHPQGDAVLKIISRIIKKEVRAIDLVGRYGGEEFIVMLPETGLGDETGHAAGALKVAERIRRAVDDEFRGLQKPLNLTISIGVAVRRFPDDRDMDHREIIRLADEQLYRAKTTGKNKVCVFTREKPQEVSS